LAKAKRATATDRADSGGKFRETVKRMLATPPKPHDDMKMGAARKRDTRSSEKGAKG
jgi:hypothetical protein